MSGGLNLAGHIAAPPLAHESRRPRAPLGAGASLIPIRDAARVVKSTCRVKPDAENTDRSLPAQGCHGMQQPLAPHASTAIPASAPASRSARARPAPPA